MNYTVVVGSDRREADDGRSTLIDHKMPTVSSATGKVKLCQGWVLTA